MVFTAAQTPNLEPPSLSSFVSTIIVMKMDVFDSSYDGDRIDGGERVTEYRTMALLEIAKVYILPMME